MKPSASTTGRQVLVADTTLRDGEQSPGAAMTAAEKLRIAAALAALNVDVIEAGFPAASPGEWDAVRRVAGETPGPVISAMARCVPADIEQTLRALESCPRARRRVHLVLATSPIHRTHKLRMTTDQVVRRCIESVAAVTREGVQVQFSAEDSSRTEPSFLDEVVDAAVRAGAGTICLPDTLGWAVPELYAAMFERAARRVPPDVCLAAHCHNDLSLAVANSLAACRAGAGQVECTVNGIGERAGNTALEEFVVALAVRTDYFAIRTGVRCEGLYELSRLVSEVTGLSLARNKPVIGANVFTTAAGIHQDGLLKDRATYEIFSPEWVGAPRLQFALSKHSGRAAVRDRLSRLGYLLGEVQLEAVFKAFVARADAVKEVSDEDLHSLASGVIGG